jgi:heme/copper-type cytochrome/quinol oxidase subunit 2
MGVVVAKVVIVLVVGVAIVIVLKYKQNRGADPVKARYVRSLRTTRAWSYVGPDLCEVVKHDSINLN